MQRIFIAGILGAIAMFVWTSVAHMVTPLGSIGFSQMPNEAAMQSALDTNLAQHSGLYFFPWVDPNDPKMMEKSAALEKAHGSGLLLYRPPGAMDATNMGPMLVKEFIKQLVVALIAAYLVSRMVGLTFAGRWSAIVLMYIAGGLVTNASYWIWYEFPLDYTLAQIAVELGSGIAAGAVIAWWLGRRSA